MLTAMQGHIQKSNCKARESVRKFTQPSLVSPYLAAKILKKLGLSFRHTDIQIKLTGANDKQFAHFKLDQVPYRVYTLKHNPENTAPQYFKILIEKYNLKPEDVIYFEHNAEAAKTAQSVGISA
jgi:hypothetical protein